MDEDTRQFIADAIDGPRELALALFFGAHPQAEHTASELARQLGHSVAAIEASADDLTAKRLLRRTTHPRPAPTSYALTRGSSMRERLTTLARHYQADESFAEELRAQFAASRTQWLLEQVLGQFVTFAAVRTWERLALQFIVMGVVAVVLGQTMRLPPVALVRVLLVMVIVTGWSALLVLLARHQRVVRIPPTGRRRRVIRTWRAWMFNRWRLEAVPGLCVLAGALFIIFGEPGGAPSVMHQWIGRPPGFVLTAWTALLAWEVAYRLGVGLWVVGLSLWRAMALRPLWGEEPGSGATARLARRLRRINRLLFVVPVGIASVGAVLFDSAIVVGLCALGVIGAGLVTLAVHLLTPSPATFGTVSGASAPADAEMRLRPGAHIAVIGGGPAGALFAHMALMEAGRTRLPVRISIFDGKDFHRFGPAGCNMCAGVISESLYQRLHELGFELPARVVQSKIAGFQLHTAVGSARIARREGTRRLRTVFRGNGPRDATLEHTISFDDYLLHCVRDQGAEVIRQPVTAIVLPDDPASPVTIEYGAGDTAAQTQADLVVGAFGLNSTIGAMMASLGFGYEPPEAVRACNAEIPLPPERGGELGDDIHILMLDLPDIVFTAFTPKQHHATMTVVGTRDMSVEDLEPILEHPQVVELLGQNGAPPEQDCRCRPRYVVRDGRNVYTDRMVMIGDAACSRLYKNGLESALVTAELAAQTVIRHGVSREAFAQHYEPGCRRRIVRDNAYGRMLFSVHQAMQHRRRLLRAHLKLMREDSRDGAALREVIWALFTGAEPYRRIMRSALNPRIHLAVLKHGIPELLRRRQ